MDYIDPKDILDGIAMIHRHFILANLNPPIALLLDSHREGVRLLSAIRQSDHWVVQVGSRELGVPIKMADGTWWMEITIMEMKVRWPADRVANPDGSWNFV